jgi:hypothetical protein
LEVADEVVHLVEILERLELQILVQVAVEAGTVEMTLLEEMAEQV